MGFGRALAISRGSTALEGSRGIAAALSAFFVISGCVCGLWRPSQTGPSRSTRLIHAGSSLRAHALSLATPQATSGRIGTCALALGRQRFVRLGALTNRSSRRRFAARLNSGVRPGEKLSIVVGFGNCIALCVLAFLLGRHWSVVRALRFSFRTHRFGQRWCAAAKRMG